MFSVYKILTPFLSESVDGEGRFEALHAPSALPQRLTIRKEGYPLSSFGGIHLNLYATFAPYANAFWR